MNSKRMKRYVVAMSDAANVDSEQVIRQLADEGFNCLENLSLLHCLLGEFEGDVSALLRVAGVVSVEEEQSMQSQ